MPLTIWNRELEVALTELVKKTPPLTWSELSYKMGFDVQVIKRKMTLLGLHKPKVYRKHRSL